MADLLNGLNEAQRDAVLFGEGPLLVLAGPGSGKTRVITHRVAQLIRSGKTTERGVLALTFTNKAAEEMRRRIGELIAGPTPTACTFHSLCARLLRLYADRVGRTPRFTIIDQRDRDRILTQVLKDLGNDVLHIVPDAVERRISQFKNELISPEDAAQVATDYQSKVAVETYAAYQELLKTQNAFDFDDLLIELANLLRRDDDVREAMSRRFQYVLVDEYQDTNLAQYAIARALASGHQNLCVTGDPDQSIYGWRGANLDNILNFEADFPRATVVRLEQNYRSTKHILAAADSLIRHNVRRKEKALLTDNPPGRRVKVFCYRDEAAEAQGVAETIRLAVDQGTRRYRDHAIFVRTVSLSRAFEQALSARRIPYQVIGGFAFFERKNVRDLLAYARVVVNPADDSALARIINVPARQIGDTTIGRLRQHARESRIPLRLAIAEAAQAVGPIGGTKLSARTRRALASFDALLSGLDPLAEEPPDRALATILEESGLREGLDPDDPEDQQAIEEFEEILASARLFQPEGEPATLARFLETLSLSSDTDQLDDRAERVTVMTLHAAKGLEFPVVFMVAFEKNIIPHERHLRDGDEEEERRLAFVGITRAREDLYLSYTHERTFHGQRMVRSVSPFLQELPKDSLDREDIMMASEIARQRLADHGFRRPAGDWEDSQEHSYEEPSIQVARGASEPSNSDRFRVGMMIRHANYGPGQILKLDGVGADRKATIHFASVGTKRFVLEKAPVSPISA